MVGEWRAVRLTNKIHGHIGIYSLIGVKMGIRALEEFRALGLSDHVTIVSHTGLVPPVSCLNDGLQISTGATLGHGAITVVSGFPVGAGNDGVVAPDSDRGSSAEPSAEFTCEGKTLVLSLKPAVAAQIRDDISRGVALYGHSPKYWKYVERLSKRYRFTLKRREIFDIVAK
ncbi:MAG: formylmethanofuran dehydrogenase subunit E family protein [Bacteroidales bacterium]|nr:formylmethanofuran dehydrogenase subunit E family protein [Bacteroidales bacterium]